MLEHGVGLLKSMKEKIFNDRLQTKIRYGRYT